MLESESNKNQGGAGGAGAPIVYGGGYVSGVAGGGSGYHHIGEKVEVDPHGKNPHELGAKLDAGKTSVWQGLFDYFPRACLSVADISTRGAKKYAWKGWEKVPNGYTRYSDALARHLVKEPIEGLYDIGPGGLGPEVLHAAQVAWNSMARLELLLRELEKKE